MTALVATTARPSIWGLLYLLLIIVTTASKNLVISLLRKARTASVYRDILYAVVRRLFEEATPLQAQYTHTSTPDGYTKGCKRWNYLADTVSLDSAAKVHWIGKRDAQYVLLYFHGGGYMLPSTRGHWEYQYQLQKKMTASGGDFSVLSLSYTLTPHGIFPTQLQQAASALRYLVKTENRDPSTIIIGGDSAGGNLASALLLHLAKPRADIAPIELRSSLLGALLISPWISLNLSHPSLLENEETDYITAKAIQKIIANFIPPGQRPDAYTDPLSAPLEWWTTVRKTVAQNFFIWTGGDEILRDGIVDFGATLKEASPGEEPVEGTVQLVVTPKEAHEQMIVDPYLRLGSTTAGGAEIEKWLAKALTAKV